ncbi:protein kinase [Streptomyces sp. NBC_00237]|uniref:serine/threonine protein kinase n=1 Tax=Streptomyces sp. NBC_00237 TaxID=2975687 RepID=UPI0022540F29|nr:serine/threonine protein kinase [Streptomyces sp. NBC_00237]MCX5201407.1 protein kinase [Streptomyces sp. NBC_00237]
MHEGSTGGQFHPLADNDPRTIASYRIAARLGAGGMGQVYLTYTPGGHPLAVKVIRPELGDDPGFRQRFRSEVQAAQRVQGLYTAPVIDFDTEGERPWLATAYVAGPSLAVAVTEHGRFPVPTVLRLIAGMAEALKVIHAAGIVHRDLKPANVLLASDGPRVIDFGIARAADATALTGTGITIGTPAFMSPEQAAGKEVGPASDVFALGQVGVYAALGNSAYGEGNSHAVLYRIVHEEPDLTGLPQELGFLARCLAKDPADRPGPAEIIDLCRAASPTPLSQQGSWLPEPMEADIHRRTEAWAAMRTRVPAPGDATHDGTHDATPSPAPSPAPGLPHAPTVTAAPSASTPPAQPPYPSQPTHPGTPAPYPTTPQHSLHAAPYPMQPQPSWTPPPPKKKMSGGVLALIVIAAVLLPVGGCMAFIANVADDVQRSSTGGSGSGGSRGSGTPRPDPKPVTYKRVNLTNDYYVRFADSPPRPIHSGDAAYEDDADFYYWSDEHYLGSNGKKVSVLNNSQKGSLKTCREETRFTERLTLSQVSPGSQLCVHTESGHIALVTFRGRSSPSDPSDYVTLDLTLWRNAEQPSGSGY